MTEGYFDRALFSPARFKVLGFLCQVEESDYPSIEKFTSLKTHDISRAVAFLDDEQLVNVRKERNGRYAQTVVQATAMGRRRFGALLEELKKYGAGR